ncbi:MAG: hypothetical protein EXR35_03970 [Limnohabitans sp.]|nr:hypothetical protein [Limnohabitans sp.]
MKDMSRLIQQGQSLIARDGSEIGCWKNRSKHIEFFEPVDDQSHYVWAPRKFSDYAITWWFIPN